MSFRVRDCWQVIWLLDMLPSSMYTTGNINCIRIRRLFSAPIMSCTSWNSNAKCYIIIPFLLRSNASSTHEPTHAPTCWIAPIVDGIWMKAISFWLQAWWLWLFCLDCLTTSLPKQNPPNLVLSCLSLVRNSAAPSIQLNVFFRAKYRPWEKCDGSEILSV